MAIGLYTSRIVLNALGVENYGIYNVVGGVVAMFNIITASLSEAISRYLTFELGKGNGKKLNVIFCTSVNIQILMSVIIVILLEIIGVWFLNSKINIAQDRMFAANWVLQFSIMSFLVSLISVPYNAAIIAHEKMTAFAYIGILEALLKLAVALVLLISPVDVLITYAFFLLMVSIIIRFIYGFYCKKHFAECHYSLLLDKNMLKDMAKFAGWNALPNAAFIINTQGINILSNIFFGVTINAARGVVTQAESIVRGFVYNFTTAVRPQIIKSYSANDRIYMVKLICESTKISYFLMLVIAMPFMFEAENILHLWLKIYPPLAPCFIRLSMCATLITLLGEMLYTNILAVGKIKQYMIAETVITVCVFPLSWMIFKLGGPAYIPYILLAISYLILIFIRLHYLYKAENFPISIYLENVLAPVIMTTPVSVLFPYIVKNFIANGNNSFCFVINVVVTILSVCFTTALLGLSSNERKFIIEKIKNRYK